MRLFGPNIKKMEANCDAKGLIEAISYKKGKMRFQVSRALIKIGTPAVVLLIAALNDKNEQVRSEVATILGNIHDARAVEPLIVALKDTNTNRNVRLRAIDALGNIGDMRALEPLIAMLNDEYWLIRSNAAEALGKLGDARAFDPLSTALNDKEVQVRKSSAKALGNFGDARAVELLIAALKDKEWLVREEVADALGKLGDVRAVKPLNAALNDKEDIVREHVTKALELITDASIVEPLEKHEVRIKIREYSAQGNINGLIHILEDKNLDYDLLEIVRNTLMTLGEDAMFGLFLALGDNQRVAGTNQLKREGRLNNAMIQLAIGKAVSDYRREFE